MEKIKQFLESEQGKDILTVIIVILVGLGSFELGRLSKSANNESGIKITYPSGELDTINVSNTQNLTKPALNTKSTEKAFFASNRGSKYYPAGCAGGQNIVQENRIYFSTAFEAERVGYELSSACR